MSRVFLDYFLPRHFSFRLFSHGIKYFLDFLTLFFVQFSFGQVEIEDLYPAPEKVRAFLLVHLDYQKPEPEKKHEDIKALSFFFTGMAVLGLFLLTYNSVLLLKKGSSLFVNLGKALESVSINTIIRSYRPPRGAR